MKEENHKAKAIIKQLRLVLKAEQAHSKIVEKACGLSSAKLWMLHEVAENPGLKVTQLAATLDIHPSTCSNMLDKLEEKELIYRDRSKTDQRSVHLFATEEGRAVLSRSPSPPQGKLGEALEHLSGQDLDHLHDCLAVLIKSLLMVDGKVELHPMDGE